MAMVLAFLALLLFAGMGQKLSRRGDGKGEEET
mgnify:CR=1 FL=1